MNKYEIKLFDSTVVFPMRMYITFINRWSYSNYTEVEIANGPYRYNGIYTGSDDWSYLGSNVHQYPVARVYE